MSQYLNHMNGGQGKLLHMGIMDLCIYKVLSQIIYDMLLELLILLNQNHTNHLHGRGHINKKLMAIVGGLSTGADAKAHLSASKDS